VKSQLENFSDQIIIVQKKTVTRKPGLYADIKSILVSARSTAYRAINFSMVLAYWHVGKRIVEEEQNGKKKANYADYLIANLSLKLTREFGRGFTERNLRDFRRFYLLFPEQEIRHALRAELSWTHYRLLLRVEDGDARNYYMREAAEQNWSTRALERQINTFTYERLLSSRNKKAVKKQADKISTEELLSAFDLIKDPYVLEFLNLPANTDLYESDLEKLIIGNLQHFLLELGKGFCFVARQQRISAEDDHFFVDLVFYNYILKCFVLIDLKVGKLSHQDIGQMDLYIRYYEDNVKTATDNPTIGIILCSEKNETIVKYSVLKENRQMFASKYKLYLPTEKQLKEELERELRRYKQLKQ